MINAADAPAIATELVCPVGLAALTWETWSHKGFSQNGYGCVCECACVCVCVCV